MSAVAVWLGWLRLFHTDAQTARAVQDVCNALQVPARLDAGGRRLLIRSPLEGRAVDLTAPTTATGFARQVLPLLLREVAACGGKVEGSRHPDLRIELRDPADDGAPRAIYTLGASRQARRLAELLVEGLTVLSGRSAGGPQFCWPGQRDAPRSQPGAPAVAVVLPGGIHPQPCIQAILEAIMRFLAPADLAQLCTRAATVRLDWCTEQAGMQAADAMPVLAGGEDAYSPKRRSKRQERLRVKRARRQKPGTPPPAKAETPAKAPAATPAPAPAPAAEPATDGTSPPPLPDRQSTGGHPSIRPPRRLFTPPGKARIFMFRPYPGPLPVYTIPTPPSTATQTPGPAADRPTSAAPGAFAAPNRRVSVQVEGNYRPPTHWTEGAARATTNSSKRPFIRPR